MNSYQLPQTPSKVPKGTQDRCSQLHPLALVGGQSAAKCSPEDYRHAATCWRSRQRWAGLVLVSAPPAPTFLLLCTVALHGTELEERQRCLTLRLAGRPAQQLNRCRAHWYRFEYTVCLIRRPAEIAIRPSRCRIVRTDPLVIGGCGSPQIRHGGPDRQQLLTPKKPGSALLLFRQALSFVLF